MDVSVPIDAPQALVWQLMAQTSRWVEWGPTVAAVDPPAQVVAAGLRGRVRIPFGVWLPFEVTSVEPGRGWRWRVAGVAATGHRVEPLGPRRCRAVIEVPWWAPGYALVCRLALRRLARLAHGKRA